MKKSILALSLLVGLSTAASSYAALPETVRIGTDTTYAPFSSKDAKGDFVGFDIDLGNEMCKRMQVKCTWVASDFDALIPSLKAKKIDAIISSLSITDKRQQEIAFSDKLYAADSRLIAAKGSPIQPTLDSLKGRLDAALQDEVAASEGFLKQPAGKDFAFAGSSVKAKNTSVMAPV
uniref:Solute-binding protein family 3/N-terminal domain-containing protein n=1 Tax=Panagrolaimus superbus TaxID=310955 RepID=A0A914YBP6_9BILA